MAAKIAKDWSLADQIRSELTDKGWQIKDGKDGFELAKLAETSEFGMTDLDRPYPYEN